MIELIFLFQFIILRNMRSNVRTTREKKIVFIHFSMCFGCHLLLQRSYLLCGGRLEVIEFYDEEGENLIQYVRYFLLPCFVFIFFVRWTTVTNPSCGRCGLVLCVVRCVCVCVCVCYVCVCVFARRSIKKFGFASYPFSMK